MKDYIHFYIELYEGVISYNGTNTDTESKKIYDEWCANSNNAEFLGRSKNINVKAAILEKFKTDGKILVTTEAGAEGLNMQFCSLVINYDLPWNPQRVEQRIGRCHNNLFAVHILNSQDTNNIEELSDPKNGLIMCKEHATQFNENSIKIDERGKFVFSNQEVALQNMRLPSKIYLSRKMYINKKNNIL